MCIESEIELKYSMPSARNPKKRNKGDGPISDPVLRFKVEFYFATIDKLLSALKERFEDFFEVVSMFDIFFDKDINEKIEALGKRFEEDLSVSPSDWCIEYDLFRNVLKTIGLNSELASPRNTYQFLLCKDMNESCPNIATLYNIFLTIPVSSASSERSFSHLKRIKSYNRCTMGQERFSQLSLINIEYTIAQSINNDDVLNTFASMRMRKLAL